MAHSIYLSGPMTGMPNNNHPAFDAAAKLLREQGHDVFSPAEHDRKMKDYGFSLRAALADDTAWICGCATAIAMLPDWEHSKGARAEHALATALGLKFIYL